MSMQTVLVNLKNAIENKCNSLISSHNADNNAHSSLFNGKVSKLMEASIYLANDDCLWFDTALVNKSSSYTPVQIENRGVVQSFSFDSDHYLLSSSTDAFTGWQLSDNRDNVEIAIDFKLTKTTVFNQALLGYFNGNTSYMIRARGDCKVDEFTYDYNVHETVSTFYTHSTAFTDNYYRLKFRRVGTTATVSIHTTDGTQLATHNFSITPSSNGKFFFGFLSGTRRDIIVKNIKVSKV